MPLKKGLCCDDCNQNKVIPKRLNYYALNDDINEQIRIDNTKPVKQIFEELAKKGLKEKVKK